MATTLTNTDGNLAYELTLDFSIEDFDKDLEKKLISLSKNVKRNGFRPGKVPLSLVKKDYEASLRLELELDLINKEMKAYLKKHNLELASEPELLEHHMKTNKLAAKIAFELYPNEPELDDLASMQLTRQISKVSSEAIEAAITDFIKKNSDLELKDGPAALDDRVNINFVGRIDGETFEGSTGSDYDLELGSNEFIAGFEAGLVGAKVEDTIVLNLQFPSDYREDLANKAVEFTVEVNSVRKRNLIDENKARELLKLTAEDDLREHFRAKLELKANDTSKANLRKAAVEKLVANYEVKIPKKMLHNIEEHARANHTEFDLEKANAELKEILLLGLVFRKFNLEIKETDYEDYFEELGRSMGFENGKFIRNFYTQYHMLDKAKELIAYNMAADAIIARASVVRK